MRKGGRRKGGKGLSGRRGENEKTKVRKSKPPMEMNRNKGGGGGGKVGNLKE